jgi:hypothetical protein
VLGAASAGRASADGFLGPVVASGLGASAAAGVALHLLVPVGLASLSGKSM